VGGSARHAPPQSIRDHVSALIPARHRWGTRPGRRGSSARAWSRSEGCLASDLPGVRSLRPSSRGRRAFTRRSIEGLEPLVGGIISGFLDELDGREEFDIVAEFAALFPVEIISAITITTISGRTFRRDRYVHGLPRALRLNIDVGHRSPEAIASLGRSGYVPRSSDWRSWKDPMRRGEGKRSPITSAWCSKTAASLVRRRPRRDGHRPG
jgi:hypothetical protein